jgi:hypothetical protein
LPFIFSFGSSKKGLISSRALLNDEKYTIFEKIFFLVLNYGNLRKRFFIILPPSRCIHITLFELPCINIGIKIEKTKIFKTHLTKTNCKQKYQDRK